jgi:hypothetical protein
VIIFGVGSSNHLNSNPNTARQSDTSTQPKAESQPRTNLALPVSIFTGAILLLVRIFQLAFVNMLTVFLEPALELVLRGASLLVLIWSLAHFIRRAKTLGIFRSATPLLINLVVMSIIWLVPISELTTELNFRWNYNRRMQVVSEVLGGKFGSSDLIHLPDSYPALSDGDDVMVSRRANGQTVIFFFTFRGILNSFAGFVYCTGAAHPENDDFGANFFEIDQLGPNRYWASSRN